MFRPIVIGVREAFRQGRVTPRIQKNVNMHVRIMQNQRKAGSRVDAIQHFDCFSDQNNNLNIYTSKR